MYSTSLSILVKEIRLISIYAAFHSVEISQDIHNTILNIPIDMAKF